MTQVTEDNQLPLARRMYEAYGASTGWKNFQGNPMPQWGELPERIQQAWMAAAEASKPSLELEERDRAQILHANVYATHFSRAGVPGHGQFMLIAKLSQALGLA